MDQITITTKPIEICEAKHLLEKEEDELTLL
jgi:hypothetical protein